MKDYRRRYRESHGIKEHKRPWKKILAGVAVLCVVGGGTFFAAQTKAASLVSIDGQEAANLTEDDINAYLDEREGELGKKTLALQADGVNETLALEKLDGHFDRERIMDEALLVGRTGTPWQRVADVVQTLRFGKDVPLSIAVDDEKLTQAIGEIHDSYNAEPQDAYASPTGKGCRNS